MKLSIIVKCCNQKDSLPGCIDSVLNQDIACDKEIILCDCASTDGSAEVMRDYAERFPELIQVLVPEEEIADEGVTDEDDTGCAQETSEEVEEQDKDEEADEPSGNIDQIIKEKLLLQKALELSTGDLFSICEASDVWTDVERCSKLLEALHAFPAAEVAYHDAYVRHASRITEQADSPLGNEAMEVDAANAIHVADSIPSLSCGLYKREVFRSVPESFYQENSRMELFNHIITWDILFQLLD